MFYEKSEMKRMELLEPPWQTVSEKEMSANHPCEARGLFALFH